MQDFRAAGTFRGRAFSPVQPWYILPVSGTQSQAYRHATELHFPCPRPTAGVKEFRGYGHRPSVSIPPWDLLDVNVLSKVAFLHWVHMPCLIVHFPT